MSLALYRQDQRGNWVPVSNFNVNRNERLKKVSSSTVNREISLISAVISKAREEWGINLPYNVARLLKRLKETAARERRLTLFEYKKLMEE